MALADGVLVAWVLVELRNAGLGDNERDSLDIVGTTILIPSPAVACLLAYPARYIGAGAWMSLLNLPTSWATGTWIASYLRWQLGWGLIYVQGAAVVFAGLFGAVAWSRGTPGDALKGYRRMLSAEGGHVVAAVATGRPGGGGALGGRLRAPPLAPGLDVGLERGRLVCPLRHPAGRADPAGRPDRIGRTFAPDGDDGRSGGRCPAGLSRPPGRPRGGPIAR